jgi:acyl-coenzyme A thioesterase PaaI-like protein
MPHSLSTPGPTLRAWWRRLAPLPGGKALFARVLGWITPYTGTIRPRVLELDGGHARVELVERRRVRNHLASVHAVALVNLAEVTTGLALLTALPAEARGILTGFSITYLKKARGRLMAECRCGLPDTSHDAEHDVAATITDAAGDVVARATARWRLGPAPRP